MNTVRQQSGVTLVELVIAIVVIGIAASVILGLLSSNVGASADPMVRQQAVAIARAYVEEIQLQSFSDPDGSDGETLRPDFDDVDDYNGLSDAGARDQFGNTIAGLEPYTVNVNVANSAALPGVPSADNLRIDVTVSRSPYLSFTFSTYRTRR